MDVTEIRDLKVQTENQIARLLGIFHEKTKCEVRAVELVSFRQVISGDVGSYHVSLEVKL